MSFKNITIQVFILLGLLFLVACRKQAFEDFYGRPENLQPPIYQVLQAKPNFKTLISIIDRSGYKAILSESGYWTFFAPNDAAFQKYFTENNSSLDKLDSATCRKIVQYALVYNVFESLHLADYQSTAGWVANAAFRRRTAYYDGFLAGAGPDGAATVMLSANRNGASYVYGDNNNKYVPFFAAQFMAAKGLGAADYNAFYPNSTYTGFNVADAQVVNKDIIAENGVIHELDRVLTPLPSLEQYMTLSSQYSEFKKLLDQFMVSYIPNNDATARYSILTGTNKPVYIKQYANLLAFSPGNENYLKLQDNDGQSDSYSMFIPNNTALSAYLQNTILEFYGTVDKLPTAIVADLVNAHLYNTAAWPSKFSSTRNFLNELIGFSLANDITDKKVCSNGFFYGTNKVQPANVFSTVYGRAYLDPAYSIMTRLLNNIKTSITNPNIRYTVFMLSDVTLRALGYDYDTTTGQFTLIVNGTKTSGTTPLAQLQRLVNLHVIPTQANELNNLAGSGILESYSGEYMKWNNNTVFAAGNLDKNQTIAVGGYRDYSNGRIYYLNNGNLEYPVATLASQIARYAGTTTSPYYDFYQYLVSSTTYSTVSAEISFVVNGGSYTIFIPTKAAIQQAVRDGFLPGTVSGTTVTPTYNPTNADDKAKVAKFIQYHVLNGVSIASDGKKSSTGSGFQTFLNNSLGDKVEVFVTNQPNNMVLRDSFGRISNVVQGANSNQLGTRALFHQIDNYLRYSF